MKKLGLFLLIFTFNFLSGTTDFIDPLKPNTSKNTIYNDECRICSTLCYGNIPLTRENEELRRKKDEQNAENFLAITLNLPDNSTTDIETFKQEILPTLPENIKEIITEADQLHEQFGDKVLFFAINKSIVAITYLIKKGADIHIKNKKEETFLSQAIKNENFDLIQYLLKHFNSDINSRCLSMAIHEAVSYNKIDVLRTIIAKSNGSINFNTENGYVLLLKSVNNGNLDILKYLIELGNLNNTYFDSMSAFKRGLCVLEMSAIANRIDILKYLLETVKVSSNITDENGLNLLSISAKYGNTEMSKYLILNQNFEDGPYREIILRYACEGGDLVLVKYLIETYNMDPNVVTIMGETLLHYAGISNNLNLLKYLIEDLKINIHKKDGRDFTLLLNAIIFHGNIDIINYLIENITLDENDKLRVLQSAASRNNFEVFMTILDYDNIRDYANRTDKSNNSTLLHFAAYGCYLDIIVYVAEVLNIEPSLNGFGENILTFACNVHKELDAIKYIINNLSVNANDTSYKGDNLLINAASNRHLDIVKYLIEFENVDVNQHSEKMNSLFGATKNGDIKTIKYLISKNANVNFQNKSYNNTALHYAAYYSLNALQYLILYGNADINILNDGQDTVFDIYKENKKNENITWFEDYLASLSNPDAKFETLIHDVVCDVKSNPKSCKFYYE